MKLMKMLKTKPAAFNSDALSSILHNLASEHQLKLTRATAFELFDDEAKEREVWALYKDEPAEITFDPAENTTNCLFYTDSDFKMLEFLLEYMQGGENSAVAA